METKTKRNNTYEGIKDHLALVDIAGDPSKKHDAHLFLAMTSDNGETMDVHVNGQGNDDAIIQLFMQTVADPNSPTQVQRAVLIAAANLLSGYGASGAELGLFLGMWIEENTGHINCNCDRCRADRGESEVTNG